LALSIETKLFNELKIIMKSETKYIAHTSWVVISIANSNLDGITGTYYDVVRANSNGTFIKTLIIKSQVTTTSNGMVRLFVKNGTPNNNVNLLKEIPIPIVKRSGRDSSFYISIPLKYTLDHGDKLLASTENGNAINVIAECFDWHYQSPTPVVDTIQYVANTQGEKITTANPNLDGTGSLVNIFTADTAVNGFSGCAILSIRIKANKTTSPGMVRLFFLDDQLGSRPILFCEVIVPALTQNGMNPAFSHEVIMQGKLLLQCGYSILASTEIKDTFSVIVKGIDWKYP
jgi:hypothetical protein